MHRSVDNIALDDISAAHVKPSKTDPYQGGVDLFIRHTGTEVCPVVALLNYLRMRASAPDSLFVFADMGLLTRRCSVNLMWDGLEKAGGDQYN